MRVCRHQWIINVSTKVWVVCPMCGGKFIIPMEATGSRYTGPVPEKFTNVGKENDAT